jgi:uncharacterized protein
LRLFLFSDYPMLDLSLFDWMLAACCAILVGMSKTGVAGLGNLVVPLMALLFGGKASSGLLLPMLVMADVFGVSYYHRETQWKHIVKVMPWALVGLGIGVLVGKQISDIQFKQWIGGIVLMSLGILIWQDLKTKDKDVPHAWYFSAIFGIMGGFATMIGNAAGPIMSVYLLSANLPKNHYIGTAAWFFFIINVLKLPLQIWAWHNITLETLTFNLLLLPGIMLGAFIGIHLVKKISDTGYRWFVMAATLVSALVLLI